MKTKPPKYLYIIKVIFDDGVEHIKIGISNNYERRFYEYRSNFLGYYVETFNVFRVSKPKRLESLIKWKLYCYTKPSYKQEYYTLDMYDEIINNVYQLSKSFGISIKEILKK